MQVLNDISKNGTKIFSELLDMVYPIGSIYMSVVSSSPSILFGGTWLALESTFLIGASGTYTAGSNGGEATVTLDVTMMPSHNHIQNPHRHDSAYNSTQGYAIGVTSTPNTAGLSGASGRYFQSEYTTATNQATGGGLAHNNMPPYLAVYMWKRTE